MDFIASCSENTKRTTNFTRSEENGLITLVKKYAHILENKKTDSVSNQKKSETWVQITKEFNSSGSTYRSVQILKNKYLNLKKNTLKKLSSEKRETYLTGGGLPVLVKQTERDRDIREILGSRLTGMASQHDHDSKGFEVSNQPPLSMEESDSEEFTFVIENSDESDIDNKETIKTNFLPGTSSNLNTDWSKCSVESLRTPVSKKLQVQNTNDTRKRDNTLKTKLSHWAKSKQDYVSIQQQCHLEEHQQKLLQAEEKHRQEIQHNKEIHEEKIKIMKEEHYIKMSILKIEKQSV